MKTVTYDQFLEFEPCWPDTEESCEKLKYHAPLKPEWSALDILALKDVSSTDKLLAVLRGVAPEAIMKEGNEDVQE